MFGTSFLRPATAALLLGSLLVACGGGGNGSGSDPATGGTPPVQPGGQTPAPAALLASSGAAGSAFVQWQGLLGNGGPWTLERQRDGEAPVVLATELREASGARVDTGLAAGTAYRWRLRDAAGAAVAEVAATTGSEAALDTAPGGASAAATVQPLGSGAGELAAGALRLRYAEGSFGGAGSATLQPRVQTLEAGVGEAWSVTLDRAPQRPLTVSIAYAADEDPEAVDAQRLAVRQADGSWWMLTQWTHDRAARRLEAVLPPALVPSAATTTGAARQALAAATDNVVRLDLVRFVGVTLRPREASVRVGGLVVFEPVAIWETNENLCDNDPQALCVPSVGLVRRALPILNTKAGYERGWQLEGSGSPDPALGTLSPRVESGAVYQAPVTVPSVNPVTVRFASRHLASGRQMAVTARVRIVEDRWVGPMTLSNATDGRGFYYDAQTHWVLDPQRSTDSVRVYRAHGRVTLHLEGDTCELTPTPADADIVPAAGLTELEVDEVTGRYHVQLNTIWDTVLTTCLGTPMPTSVGVTFDHRGSIAAGRIQGSQQDGSVTRHWNLQRP